MGAPSGYPPFWYSTPSYPPPGYPSPGYLLLENPLVLGHNYFESAKNNCHYNNYCPFFCGIPICLTIRRHKSTDDISSFPFLMGFLGGASWLIFGILKWEVAMIRVNLVGVAMMAYYLAFYMLYTRSKSLLITQIVMVVVWIISSVAFMILFPNLAFAYYGIPCAIFNIINFGAPLAGLAIVFKRGPVVRFWTYPGYLEIIIPNGAGMMLSLIQLSLFIVFPRLPGKHSPLGWYIKAIRRMESQRMRKQGHELFGVEYGITSMGKTFDLLAHTLPDPCTSAFPNRRESSKHIRFL
uniref:Sugar transporter SWEET n=1 Tax=Ditylenchus dipsaci TaxID=166011 RepID=A0A915D5P1_9BILA